MVIRVDGGLHVHAAFKRIALSQSCVAGSCKVCFSSSASKVHAWSAASLTLAAPHGARVQTLEHAFPHTLSPSAGEVHAWSAASLTRLRRVKQAHMVFATAVAVPPGEAALLSVSADASACVIAVQKRKRGGAKALLIPLLVLLLAVIVYYVHMARGVGLHWRGARRLIQELRDPYDSNVS